MSKLNATTYNNVAANTVDDAVLDADKIAAWYLDLKNVVNENSPEGRYAADAGTTDAYAVTLDPVPTAYVTGMVYRFQANTANTGAATVNVNSLGAKTIKKNVSDDLETGDILADQMIEMMYDGTNMQLISASSELKTHKNEIVSKVTMITEPFDQTTVTTVNLGFQPKQIRIDSDIEGTAYHCTGSKDAGGEYTKYWNVGAAQWNISSGTSILFLNSGSANIAGTITITSTGITISWIKTGDLPGISGKNRRLIISALTH